MKRLPLLSLLFFLLAGSALAQSKTEFGITTEGSWFLPGNYDNYSPQNKNGFGVGIGVFASRNIFGKLSADIGVTYRHKKMKEYYEAISTDGNYSPYGYGYGFTFTNSGKIQGWKGYPLDYVVVPLHLNFDIRKFLFLSGGIEASRLTNFDTGNDKIEWNWIVGFGSLLNRLKWSLNFIRGFKSVAFANNLWTRSDGLQSATAYQNNMIQVSLSYPIWKKK